MKLISVLLSYSRRTVVLAIIGGIISGACNAALLAIIHAALTAGRAAPAKLLRLNGAAVTDENRDWYRQHFTVVFSDFFLFDSLLGLEAPQLDDKARAYLVKLQLHHKLEVKEGVLSTTQLSQGQLIVISHDDHYYDVADRLIKLEDGKLEYDRAQLEPREQALTLA